MKLIVAVVQDRDAGMVVQALLSKGYSATKLSSTGGFLREGSTTLLVGVQESEVDRVLDIMKAECHSRKQLVAPVLHAGTEGCVPYPVEITVGGMTAFVLDIERFEKA